MSEPTFYLFPKHQNFQPGKSRLEKAAVYDEFNAITALVVLFATIAFCWASGYFYRSSQNETYTLATVLSCEQRSGYFDLSYEYFVDNQRYEQRSYISWEELNYGCPGSGSLRIY